MSSQNRIRLARRFSGLSQARLAQAVGVQRSAVSHWEASNGKDPTVAHMREIAVVTGVQFEWLATGRGSMNLSKEVQLDSIATARALLVEDALELRLLHAFREVSTRAQLSFVEIVEHLAVQRTRRPHPQGSREAQRGGRVELAPLELNRIDLAGIP